MSTRQIRLLRAPYNFVPLPDNVITVALTDLPPQDRYDPDRLTGYLESAITTESPVYVRCPFTLEEYQRAQQKGSEDDTHGDNGSRTRRTSFTPIRPKPRASPVAVCEGCWRRW